MIEKSKRRQDYYSSDSIIKDCKQVTGVKNPTAEQVLEFMIGNSDRWTGGEYVVYRYDSKSKRSFINRLNMCWVYPLFLLSIPLQFLFLGEVGVNRNTRLGRVIDRLVKFV